ncbi:MAG TPA: hypothetical protein VJH75_00700 [Patescibacteria group bacterium]|nr:hypothetical protein [Patescibacteria group bacterium]
MTLSPQEQLKQVLGESQHILLTFCPSQNDEALPLALAWKNWFEKQGKQIDLVVDNYATPGKLKFLSTKEEVKPNITNLQKFIVKVDLERVKLDTLSYDIKDKMLYIYLTPKEGIITKNELRTAQSTFRYDAIIVLNTPDLESLGGIYQNNTDLFYRVPIVDIDNHPGNEHFGQINFVDITTPTVTEVTLKIFESLRPELIDEKISTSLLTALILKTKNFKAPNLSPQTLELASKLINYGADRELIMRHLYRSRSISALKLWGQALSRLQSQAEIGLVWTTLTREDFTRSGAAEDELKDVIDELIVNAPEAKIVILLYEDGPSNQNPQEIHVIISVDKNFDATELSKKYNPTGNKKMASFIIRKDTLQKAEEEIIEHLKKEIKTSHN